MSNENKPIANSIKEQTYYKGKTAEVRKWAFASGELVYNLPWMLISSFLAFFMTDIAILIFQYLMRWRQRTKAASFMPVTSLTGNG